MTPEGLWLCLANSIYQRNSMIKKPAHSFVLAVFLDKMLSKSEAMAEDQSVNQSCFVFFLPIAGLIALASQLYCNTMLIETVGADELVTFGFGPGCAEND